MALDPRKDEMRFWAKGMPEPNSGCLLWTGTLSNNGYGVERVGSLRDGSRRIVSTNRLACEYAHGPAPSLEHQALHHCDVKLCIEGTHLYWGTRADNGRDASERGRTGGIPRPGELNGNAKLTTEQALDIKTSSGSAAELAKRYDVSPTHIGYIRSGKSWGHLNGP